jgi:hypothetical protein
MKLTNVIATGVILIAIAFSANAQNGVKKAEDKKAKNVAQRDRAEKNGHPKQAVKDEKKVQQDNKNIKKDKAENKAEGK